MAKDRTMVFSCGLGFKLYGLIVGVEYQKRKIYREAPGTVATSHFNSLLISLTSYLGY